MKERAAAAQLRTAMRTAAHSCARSCAHAGAPASSNAIASASSLAAAQLSQLTVDELRYQISLRTGDMSGLHLPKATLIKKLIAVENTRKNMQNAIRASNPNMPLRLP